MIQAYWYRFQLHIQGSQKELAIRDLDIILRINSRFLPALYAKAQIQKSLGRSRAYDQTNNVLILSRSIERRD